MTKKDVEIMRRQEDNITRMTGPVVQRKKGEHLAYIWEIAMWLAVGNGQVCDAMMDVQRSTKVSTSLQYGLFETYDFPGTLAIKKWEDTEWHVPTLEYMEFERKKGE